MIIIGFLSDVWHDLFGYQHWVKLWMTNYFFSFLRFLLPYFSFNNSACTSAFSGRAGVIIKTWDVLDIGRKFDVKGISTELLWYLFPLTSETLLWLSFSKRHRQKHLEMNKKKTSKRLLIFQTKGDFFHVSVLESPILLG